MCKLKVQCPTPRVEFVNCTSLNACFAGVFLFCFSPVVEYVITYLVANNLACMIAFLKLYTSRL